MELSLCVRSERNAVELRGFGSFRVRQHNARLGRNPQTGTPVEVPAKRVPYFRPGKELKALVAGSESVSAIAN